MGCHGLGNCLWRIYIKSKVFWISGFLVVMWGVEIVNGFMGHRLSVWGILPRTTQGLIGIPLSPILHGSLNHVLSNTIPFLVLGGLVALRGSKSWWGFLCSSSWLADLQSGC